MIEPNRTTLGDRYRLEEVIGRGGMSTVYRAIDLELGRIVAVKVLLAALADQDPSYAARFQREARAAAALASSAVVTVFDTGIDDGSQYIVMEYVDGQSLADVLRDERPLPLEEAIRVTERVAAALAAAHGAGILHRDIKPANVMIGSDGTVKLLDFGIARKLDGTTLTQVASVIGTAAYMAPERALGETGDARADVYSLGCLLYAMLTGRPPFGGEVAAAVLHQQINAAPRPPGELRSGIPRGLAALVLAMLAKSPEDRPGSAQEVKERLAGATETAAMAGTAATAAIGGTAATAPLRRTAATAALPGAVQGRGPRPTGLADHRRRAVVMALATGAVTLAAVLLLSIGGSSHNTSATHPATTPTTPRTTPATTTTHPATTQTTQSTTPANPPPPGPQGKKKGHGGGPPPGHGGGGQNNDGGN